MSSVCELMHITFLCVAFGVHSFRNYFSLFFALHAFALLSVLVRRSIHIFVFYFSEYGCVRSFILHAVLCVCVHVLRDSIASLFDYRLVAAF